MTALLKLDPSLSHAVLARADFALPPDQPERGGGGRSALTAVWEIDQDGRLNCAYACRGDASRAGIRRAAPAERSSRGDDNVREGGSHRRHRASAWSSREIRACHARRTAGRAAPALDNKISVI